jgi:hypothetical protein
MLPTFRLIFFAAGLVIVALAVTTRGLVPEPEARTRIGEVPTLGRSLVQQAMIPPAAIGPRSASNVGQADELRGTQGSAVPVTVGALAGDSPAGDPSSASVPVASTGAHGDPAQAVGGEDVMRPAEAPDGASPQDVALAPSTMEEASDRAAPGSEQAPAAPAPEQAAMAPGRSALGAVESLFMAPSLPSLAALRLSVSSGLNELTENPVPAGVPAMAFAAEPDKRSGSGAADRTGGNRPADATAADEAASGTAAESKASKTTKSAKANKHSKRSAAKRSRKKVKSARRSSPAKADVAGPAAAPSTGGANAVQGVPRSYQYLYAIPLRTHLSAPEWTAVR